MTCSLSVKVGVLMASALLGSACTESADLPTDEIDASVSVFAYSDYVQLLVILGDGLATVELSPGDTLTAAMDSDRPVTLEQTELGSYEAIVERGDVSTIVLGFSRESAESLETTLQIPPVPQIEALPDGVDYAYADGTVKLRWSNPVQGASVRLWGYPCKGAGLTTDAPSFPDDGVADVPVESLTLEAPPEGGACITVQMVRQLTVPPDPRWAPDSETTLERVAEFEITLMP